MKNIVCFILLLCSAPLVFSQIAEQEAYIQPLELATILDGPNPNEYLIFNTGPVNDIKKSINIGPVSESKSLKKFKKRLNKLDKDQAIVIYCGCCPLASCPNITPALDLAKSMHFTQVKVLNLPEDLKVDWIDKGYPMNE